MIYDLLIIGGGVNGCGIARDAAGRGLSVALFEKDDLASGTSSASTKLIHGGLRYLEYYEFRLVREALAERERLLRIAPHLVRPMRFVLPHHAGLRPAWLLRLGLFIYDHLGGRKLLPPSRSLDLQTDDAGVPLAERNARAFEYSDCWVDDARLVVLNAMDAAAKGALVETRARVISAERREDGWRVSVEKNGVTQTYTARVIVNAAGPWTGEVLGAVFGKAPARQLRIVQGSHIVVAKLFDHDRSYIFQNKDGRIVFAIPYERDFTLIGTTDRDWNAPIENISASPDEIAYLCGAVNEYFTRQITPVDVVWSFSGVRPLVDDSASKAQAASRDYVLSLDQDGPPLLTVFGGKITTYRSMAERAMEKLSPLLPHAKRGAWTASAPLPGGDFPVAGFAELAARVANKHPYLDANHSHRLARAYGTRAFAMLDGVTSADGLGRCFGCDLFEVEVRYLTQHEWARTAADIVWRRTKCGLRMTREEVSALDDWMRENLSA